MSDLSEKSSLNEKSGRRGLTLGDLLLILFIGLKLGGVITWSWWWVLSPLWLGWAIVLVIFGITGISFLISESVKRSK
jgi:hypothetical protein